MTRSATAERERTWACTARPSRRPEQRRRPPRRLDRAVQWISHGVGFAVAVGTAMVVLVIVLAPLIIVSFWLFAWFVGADSGTGGGD
jgi:hypothetical protein